MTKRVGTIVYAPVVAGGDTADDMPVAFTREMYGSIQRFDNIADRDAWSTAYPSRRSDTLAIVAGGDTTNKRWFEWVGEENAGKWVNFQASDDLSLRYGWYAGSLSGDGDSPSDMSFSIGSVAPNSLVVLPPFSGHSEANAVIVIPRSFSGLVKGVREGNSGDALLDWSRSQFQIDGEMYTFFATTSLLDSTREWTFSLVWVDEPNAPTTDALSIRYGWHASSSSPTDLTFVQDEVGLNEVISLPTSDMEQGKFIIAIPAELGGLVRGIISTTSGADLVHDWNPQTLTVDGKTFLLYSSPTVIDVDSLYRVSVDWLVRPSSAGLNNIVDDTFYYAWAPVNANDVVQLGNIHWSNAIPVSSHTTTTPQTSNTKLVLLVNPWYAGMVKGLSANSHESALELAGDVLHDNRNLTALASDNTFTSGEEIDFELVWGLNPNALPLSAYELMFMNQGDAQFNGQGSELIADSPLQLKPDPQAATSYHITIDPVAFAAKFGTKVPIISYVRPVQFLGYLGNDEILIGNPTSHMGDAAAKRIIFFDAVAISDNRVAEVMYDEVSKASKFITVNGTSSDPAATPDMFFVAIHYNFPNEISEGQMIRIGLDDPTVELPLLDVLGNDLTFDLTPETAENKGSKGWIIKVEGRVNLQLRIQEMMLRNIDVADREDSGLGLVVSQIGKGMLTSDAIRTFGLDTGDYPVIDPFHYDELFNMKRYVGGIVAENSQNIQTGTVTDEHVGQLSLDVTSGPIKMQVSNSQIKLVDLGSLPGPFCGLRYAIASEHVEAMRGKEGRFATTIDSTNIPLSMKILVWTGVRDAPTFPAVIKTGNGITLAAGYRQLDSVNITEGTGQQTSTIERVIPADAVNMVYILQAIATSEDILMTVTLSDFLVGTTEPFTTYDVDWKNINTTP